MVRAVFFDIGETLIDETRQWTDWADCLDIPRFTFLAVLGGVIARGESHRRVFELLRPDIDIEEEDRRRRSRDQRDLYESSDLYPDAVACLESLREAGYRVGLVGNQPEGAEQALQRLGLPFDMLASSAGWGVAKPDPAFFARIAETAGLPAGEIAYVGDRLDNDVLPAKKAGMVAVFLRRGPWGVLHAARPEAQQADIRLDSLIDLLPAPILKGDEMAAEQVIR